MKRKTTQRSVLLVGLGNWGSSLAHALQEAGVPLREVILTSDRRRTRGLPLTTLQRATLEADIWWLCVPDSVILPVTRRLVARAAELGVNLETRLVVHSSGALSSEELAPAASAGARVASVHPLMSFPARKPVSLRAIPFGVEADAAGRRILNRILRRLGGQPFSLASGHKALYHAAGTLASPLLVSHLAAVEQAGLLAGLRPHAARALMAPIMRATLDNVLVRGAGNSFSGPIARGDVETIRLHLKALEPHPKLAAVYRSLALFAVDALPAPEGKKMRRLLRPARVTE